jgi:hypothetical protein
MDNPPPPSGVEVAVTVAPVRVVGFVVIMARSSTLSPGKTRRDKEDLAIET